VEVRLILDGTMYVSPLSSFIGKYPNSSCIIANGGAALARCGCDIVDDVRSNVADDVN